MNKKELAQKYFTDGYNCAQAVALAFAEEYGYTNEQMAALASSFGGGIGRMREVCGALSGAVIIAGLHNGYESPTDADAKAAHYDRVQKVCKAFEAQMGSVICRELLDRPANGSPVADARDKAFYEERPCKRAVGTAAEIMEEYIRG